MSKKLKNVCKILNYIEYFHNLASTITGLFPFLLFLHVSIPTVITSSAIRPKFCAITARIKKYKSTIKKKKKIMIK